MQSKISEKGSRHVTFWRDRCDLNLFVNAGHRSSAPFLTSHLATMPESAPVWAAIALPTPNMQGCIVHSHFISSFVFLRRLIPRPLSRTLCHLASSLRWQSSRRSPLKHDCLHLWSHPWHNRYEIRAARSMPRIVFHSTRDFKCYHYFPLLKMKFDPIALQPPKNTALEHWTLLDGLKLDCSVRYPEDLLQRNNPPQKISDK